MKTSDLDYTLPEELIAQTPIEPRDAARLLVLDRATGALEHRRFRDIGDYLRRGDVLVFNETRVLPARLRAVKIPTGGRVEVLLLRRLDATTWEGLVGGSGVRSGTRLRIIPFDERSPVEVTAEVTAELDRGGRVLRFDRPIDDQLDALGEAPLPPYIHAPLRDPERYQTVYARTPGSAAAPTAGLHFTPALMQSLREQGVVMAFVELRVGLDTFRPIDEEEVERHQIHTEYCRVSAAAAAQIEQGRRGGGRVIAVGTTAVRTLETAVRAGAGRLAAFEGDTGLFITPGFQFSSVDALITNFHLPRSTLLALVAAFAGREKVLDVYRAASAERYRFFSFGDAMLIL
ncbi:MAG TPA: tRNA preQ1(34) S-adenosylmethionine ribosyltransferase-isomerase QueA [Anaerolineae bacterium]|nr:tRNA preQ1(34) S-adenosylmethionine ribosyltransferase-isomerase QueA [Anaerolineae bacterium]